MTLNVAHGRGLARHQRFVRGERFPVNLEAIRALLRQSEPDVVALQEADGRSSWSGRIDHVGFLARDAFGHAYRGSHSVFDTDRIDYGTALLSQLELESPRSHAFRVNWRDTKGFVVATVAVPQFGGRPVDVVSVHLDYLSARVRRRQVDDLIARLTPRRHPIILQGDLNCTWKRGRGCVRELADRLELSTHSPTSGEATAPSGAPRRRIDWILISRELEFVRYRALDERVSDHRPVIADIRLRQARPSSAPSGSPSSMRASSTRL